LTTKEKYVILLPIKWREIMNNLLSETRWAITSEGYTIEDIRFIVSGTNFCDWNAFEKVADFEYQEGRSGSWEDHTLRDTTINQELKIIFKNGARLERRWRLGDCKDTDDEEWALVEASPGFQYIDIPLSTVYKFSSNLKVRY
jgi:hypothetical protein